MEKKLKHTRINLELIRNSVYVSDRERQLKFFRNKFFSVDLISPAVIHTNEETQIQECPRLVNSFYTAD